MLKLSSITKDFPGVRALDGVDLDVGKGEVLGLVGENGAGKSTLIKVLGGVHAHGSYGGDIEIDGEVQRFRTAKDARDVGIATVHQELSLIPHLTVAENLLLGNEPRRFGMVDGVAMVAEAKRMLEGVAGSTEIDPEVPVSRLGVGTQQLVEIARALATDAKVVILDEPTAALTDTEAERLFELVRASAAEGTAFIYISHHLEEIFDICDRITVLRDGSHVATRKRHETNPDEVVSFMIGKELRQLDLADTHELGETMLRVEHLSVAHPSLPGRHAVRDLSFHVRAGEVVTLAGSMGSGRTATLQTLFGLARSKVTGRVEVDGKPMRLRSPKHAVDHGLALVPEDRKDAGLVLGMTVAENLMLAQAGRGGWLVDAVREERECGRRAEKLGVRAAGLGVQVSTLSGGNQQKVVLGKWLLTEPRVLLLDEPTRGVDVGAKAEIYRLINSLAQQGMAVLMASSDLPEILTLSDRVLVLRDGELGGELTRAEASEEAILQLSVGYRHREAV